MKEVKEISEKEFMENYKEQTPKEEPTKVVNKDNNINFKDLDYIPYVTISLTEDVYVEDGTENQNKKYIAFTFDDGPSKYTKELIKTLELNNSSATFFMLGNRMKYNEDIVKEVYNSNSEVASHTYSHKNLNKLSSKDILSEINSPVIAFNEITGGDIKYLRPPYGNYNDIVKSTNYPIILWNIDPKDWLVKDSSKVYNSVLKHACDGCIVLMHDIKYHTVDALRSIIQYGKNNGYTFEAIDMNTAMVRFKVNN